MSELTQFEKQGLVHLMMSYAGKQDQELGDFKVVKPSHRKALAQQAVADRDVSIRLACEAG